MSASPVGRELISATFAQFFNFATSVLPMPSYFLRRIRVNSGIIDISSPYSVPQTLARLQAILKERGVTVFALVDHSGEAAKVGLEMRPTQLLIFGDPKSGTPLMVAAPKSAIDLPLKALAWEDEQGKVWLSYNTPEYLQQRHGFPVELMKNIAGPAALLQKAVE